MKSLKVLAAVIALGSAFGGAGVSAAVVSICPVGGVCTAPAPEPASSKSNAVSVDVTRAPVAAPVIVVSPTPVAGSYCGWAAANSGSDFYSGGAGAFSNNIPCEGHSVVSVGNPGGSSSIVADCPPAYALVTTGVDSQGTGYFSCLKL